MDVVLITLTAWESWMNPGLVKWLCPWVWSSELPLYRCPAQGCGFPVATMSISPSLFSTKCGGPLCPVPCFLSCSTRGSALRRWMMVQLMLIYLTMNSNWLIPGNVSHLFLLRCSIHATNHLKWQRLWTVNHLTPPVHLYDHERCLRTCFRDHPFSFSTDMKILIELIQLSDIYAGGRLLAYYEGSARDFLYPFPSYSATYGTTDRELLLERSLDFPVSSWVASKNVHQCMVHRWCNYCNLLNSVWVQEY